MLTLKQIARGSVFVFMFVFMLGVSLVTAVEGEVPWSSVLAVATAYFFGKLCSSLVTAHRRSWANRISEVAATVASIFPCLIMMFVMPGPRTELSGTQTVSILFLGLIFGGLAFRLLTPRRL